MQDFMINNNAFKFGSQNICKHFEWVLCFVAISVQVHKLNMENLIGSWGFSNAELVATLLTI